MDRLVCILIATALALTAGCSSEDDEPGQAAGGRKPGEAREEVRLMTLAPGHFHAALVQKTMYDGVAPEVHVYAPEGPDVGDHLNRIKGFNERDSDPTSWKEVVYTGGDYLEKMLADGPGNVVVLSGNNRRKAEFIRASAAAGLHVLADKPMCIDGQGFKLIEEAFAAAGEKGVLVYDIMTERFEITTILQKELAAIPAVLGDRVAGTPEDPAVVKSSVHHFSKTVAGNPIKRPFWFFDTDQQGEGIVDVTTHLVDLVMWGLFPGEALDFDRDVELTGGRRWSTMLSREQFSKVTRLGAWPGEFKDSLSEDGLYPCYANGEILFALRGLNARVTVEWKFEAPEGGGDTHYSLIRGSRARLVIRQGQEQNYRPELYVEPADDAGRKALAEALPAAVAGLQDRFPGIALNELEGRWQVTVPDNYRIGHEAHFRQVTENFLRYLREGRLPDWEVPNMITKYRITTGALAGVDRDPPPTAGMRIPDFDFIGKETFTCGEAAHTVDLYRHGATGLDFVLVPAGTFRMGSPKGVMSGQQLSAPQRDVTVPAFLMCRTEATQRAWDRIGGGDVREWRGPELPIEGVSWHDAGAWCDKAGLRLPTEAEWEYACRAGVTTPFCYGSDPFEMTDYGWVEQNSRRSTQPVGRKKPNAFGLLDMHGNVWEWCHDWMAVDYVGAPTDGSAYIGEGEHRVYRGGGFARSAEYCRSGHRYRCPAETRHKFLGFRPAASLPIGVPEKLRK